MCEISGQWGTLVKRVVPDDPYYTFCFLFFFCSSAIKNLHSFRHYMHRCYGTKDK
jgi:hypothetical protein